MWRLRRFPARVCLKRGAVCSTVIIFTGRCPIPSAQRSSSRLAGGFQDAYTYISRSQVFAAGAGLGSLVTEFTEIRAILGLRGLLLVSFILMFIRDDREA